MTIFAAEVVSWRLRRIWVIVHVLAGPRFRSTTTRTTGVAASPSDESADIMKALLLKTDEEGRAAAARTSSHAPPPMWSDIALQAASVAGDGKGQLVSSGAAAGAHEEKAHLKKTDDAGVIESPPPRVGGVGGATPAGASNDLSTTQDKKRGPQQGQGDDWLGTLLGVNLLLFLLSGYRLTVLNREQRRTGSSGGAGGSAGLELT